MVTEIGGGGSVILIIANWTSPSVSTLRVCFSRYV